MRERGNILFLILLAIVLFAALSYAIMGQREQAPASMHKEQAESLAASLLQEASLTEQNVMRAKLVDGIPDYGFDFNYPNSMSGPNATCTQTSCRIFKGGGKSVPIDIPPWGYTGDSRPRFMVVQIANVGTSKDEIIYLRGYLRREVCEAINRGLGIEVNLILSDAINGDATRNYTNDMTSVPDNSGGQFGETGSSGVPAVAGKQSFCVNNQSWGYMFVHVLIPR